MSQTQDTRPEAVLNALRAAATSGQISLLREIQADVVLLHEQEVLPELLRICSLTEGGQNLALLNATWKLLLSVSSLQIIKAPVYSSIVQFMLSHLHNHVFSHDWSDGRKIKLAIFFASHVVSAVRAHPFYVACDAGLVKTIVELYFVGCLTVATSGRTEAAKQLHQGIVVRLLAIFEALGSAKTTSQPLSSEAHLQLLLRCLDGQSCDAVAELPSSLVAPGLSLAALALMLAATRSFQVSDSAYMETLMTVFLLWVPDMQVVLYDLYGNEGKVVTEGTRDQAAVALLCRLVIQHARNFPRAVFFATCVNNEVAESLGEVNLNTQLLLLLRDLACRWVDALRFEGWRDVGVMSAGCGDGCGGSLLRCRVFGLLLTALLVPNDASTAFVLLVWEAVLNRLSHTELESLWVELLQLCEEQFSAFCELPLVASDNCDKTAKCLRRFLNAIAVLLAEIKRLLRCKQETPFDALSQVSVTRFSSESSCFFSYLVDALYHQSCLYQWWNEKTTSEEVVICGNGAEATLLQDELRFMLEEWKEHFVTGDDGVRTQQFCASIISIPGKLKTILEHVSSPLTITSLLLAVTRLLQSTVEIVGRPFSRALHVCARFVAAELVAVMGFVPSEDQTFLASVRRLVDISFAVAEDGKEVRVGGMLLYHAAVCLRNFVQRNTVVSLEKLRLPEVVSTTLMSLLLGGVVGDAAVDMRDYESLLTSQVDAWQTVALRHDHTTASSQTNGLAFDSTLNGSPCLSLDNAIEFHDGDFLLPLQRCEGTVRSVLRWLEAGRSLQPLEEDVLARLVRLVRGASSIGGGSAQTNTAEPACSLDTVAGDVQTTVTSPEIIID